ncbi:amino acid adenylation domain-containing protein [Nonomuraea sp. NPDC049421]|uniref:amino acid adenylation domain-containing protein n=1 Tax=Nonomuraea sp. NPDC049421 TaxID=3155275 RepID=UPI0034315314
MTQIDIEREEALLRRRAGGRSRIPRADRGAPLPLSYGQQQMWFLNRLEPDSPEYLVPMILRLTGPVDVAALRRAIDEIAARHEILRTRYAVAGAEPVQLVDPPGEVPFRVDDLRGGDEERALRIAEDEVARGMDLAEEWPVRVRLVRVADELSLLVVVFHHIACDEWSLRLFEEELSALYRAPGALPQPPLQYADYAAHQRARAADGAFDGTLSYWREQLADLVPTEPPADRPRPDVRDWRGAAVPIEVDARLGAALREIARGRETTLFTVLLAGFQALLARYTGRTDVTVGTVVSDRNRPELQGMFGYGINSLVMRGRWRPGETFAGLLAGTQAAVLDALDHQDMPFSRLVDELEPARDRSRTPLFRVAFTMHEPKAAALDLPGVRAESLEAPWRISKFDLTLQLQEAPDGSLIGQVEYATALFDRETIERTAANLVRLLAGIAAAPDTPVDRLDLLGPDELALATGPVRPRPADPRTLPEAFLEQVRATPGAVAVTDGGRHLTYAELNARANRLAHRLRGAGVGAGSLVGVCLDRSAELVVTLLAVLKAGGAYLPLDPAYPADRLAFMVSDAGVPVVVTRSEHLELVERVHGGEVIVLDRDAAAIESHPDTDLGPASVPGDLIYVIYTSGSTGRPKGMCLTHANVLRLLTATRERFGSGPDDVWPMFHSYAFDVSVWELWGALLHGGRLVIVPFDTARSPDDLMDLLVEQRVTVLNQTPGAFYRLVRLAAQGDPRVDRLALRLVIFAGERLEMPDLRPWTDRRGLTAPALVNMYGITETTVHVTHYEVAERDLEPAEASPVGRPIDDLWVVLLDERGNVVPLGATGEICVGGAGVGRGYLDRPGLTAQRFVPDPYGPPGSRLYRSGDLARRRPDGGLEYLGRIDDQVKIRGYRVEPGEIQARLRADDRLRDAVVVAREDVPGAARLIAYVVPADPAAFDPGELRATLAGSLPDYMVPAAFVPVAEIPLTAQGKVDRRALPAPGDAALPAGAGYVAPRTAIEELIATVWTETLPTGRVGVHDDFFELGGDSILAVVLAGGLRDAGLDVRVADLFETRTVATLAARLDERGGEEESRSGGLTPVRPFALLTEQDRAKVPGGVLDAYPMSRLQTGMVVEMLSDGDLNLYLNATAFRVLDDRPLEPDLLREATRTVVGRHEALRTSLALTGYSAPMQLVHRPEDVEVNVPVADLGDLDLDGQRVAVRAFVTSERTRLFDLAKPPLIRVSAHRCAAEGWWITITECHAVLEGWSYHSLLMEILTVYRALRDGTEATLADLPAIRYADFIAAEQAVLADDAERAYWRSIVTSVPKFALPAGLGAGQDAPRREYRIRIPLAGYEEGLRAAASAAGVPLKSMLLAAHMKVMSTLTDQRAFFTGLVFHARLEAPGADRVHGLYLNTLPFPYERGARTWGELARRLFEQETELWSHQRFPMPEIQRDAGPERLIDTRFVYLDFHQVDTDLFDGDSVIDDSPTEFGLGVHILAGHLMVTANVQHVSEEAVDRLGAMYRAALESIAEGPDGDADAVLLPPGEYDRLVTELNVTRTRPVDASVLDLFERQAAGDPGAVAAAFDGGSWTYAELDARANRVAHRLRALGAGPESAVGVLAARGPDLLASLIGVWKSGAAFVPLDPSFPAGRMATMLADAGARAVVTDTPDAFIDVDVDAEVEIEIVNLADASLDGLPATSPGVRTDLDGVAQIIFTSGSTGRPKGVLVTHRGLANHVRWAAEELAAQGTTGAPLFSSVAFDLVVPNVWAPLATGQPVRLLPADLDLSRLGRELAEHGPYSFIKLTPGHLDVLAGQLKGAQAARLAEMIVVAGEALPGSTAQHWLRVLGPGGLVNEYGPTEATVGTCTYPIMKRERDEIVPIGRPLPGMTMYVLDEHMRPAPFGVTGELYVGGTGVARGYAGRPGLTADRFVPDPFGPPGGRLYRTGDRAWVRGDGAVCFAGRVDDQVKVRGYRVEPGEIRVVLLDHPGVRDAVVVVRAGEAGDRSLVAYCVPADAALPPAAELAAHCGTRLPDYMVPALFVPLDRIPLNANGKVDRTALPDPDPRGQSGSAHVEPRNELETLVAEVWRTVLGHERIGVHDNFFERGGHSIRAVTVVGALQEEGLDVSVQDVFEHRTVAELAATLAGREKAGEERRAVEPFALVPAADLATLPGGITDAYPLSEVQRGMIVEMLAGQEHGYYHNTMSFLVRDPHPFSLDALRAAAGIAAARHEALRTSIRLSGHSVPMQLVHESAEIPVRVLDLRGLDDGGRELAMRNFRAQERAHRFDLERPPLIRITALLKDDASWWLSFTVLHAVSEGWSFHGLLMELLDDYRALRDGAGPPRVEPPSVRYADFIAAELRALESADDRAYWREVVTGRPGFALPAAWGEPHLPREDYHVVLMYADLEERLRALAAQAGASLKSVLLAAHLKVLGMLTSEPEFVTGLVCNGRLEAQGGERVYGMHLNTLPFAYDRGARTWLDLIRRTFDGELALWPHRRFPMPVIQRELGDGRRLIGTAFSYQDFDQVDTGLIDVTATEGEDPTEFALGVPATPTYLILRSNTHAMSRRNADRLAAMHRAVLEAMVADPDGDARATCLPPSERTSRESVPAVEHPLPRSLHEVFERRARETPDAVAVVHREDPGGRLTYGELDVRANRLAHRLRELGAGPETLVGVCLEPGTDLVVTLLAVLKAGAAYLPLPPTSPADRLRFMLADSGAAVAVTTAVLAPSVTAEGIEQVLLDTGAARIAALPATPPESGTEPGHLAYVCYTSGSTGRPKGVAVTHANVLRLYAALSGQVALGSDRTWALLHSYAFDVSVWELWGALLHGGRLVIVPTETARSPRDLLDLLIAERVTTLSLSPVAFRSMIGAADGDEATLARLSLREVVFGGDRLEPSDLDAWGLDRCDLAHAYGPTECTIHVTYQPLTPADLGAGLGTVDGVPIGRPLDDVRTYVLDPYGHEVPEGAPGELYVGGAGVARGYLGRPGLTAERFVPDPFGPPGARYYRTGDLVRRRADGALHFLGRVDDQVKVRGHRIEPGEIQAVLAAHPAVRESVVVARGDGPARRLVAYCVPDGGKLPPAADLAAYCGERLPDYMVPAAFVPLEAVPLTVNGKLDQRALPAPDRAALWSSERDFVAPRTPAERTLAGIWSRLLGVDPVGAHDRFFDLGGDSLTILKAMTQAREAGLPVTLRLLYQHGSIAELATALDGAGEPGAGPALTPAQRRVLARPGGHRYDHWQLRVPVPEQIDAATLADALHAVAAHHAIPVSFRRVEADDRAAAAAYERLDPEHGPLLSAVLATTGADRPVLILAVHELAADRASLPILLRDLETACRGSALPEGDGGTLRRWAAALPEPEDLMAQAHHWLTRTPAPPLPLDHPSGTGTVRSLSVPLPEPVPSREEVLAALAVVLARWSGGDRVLLDVETRAGHAPQDAAGPFAHRFPVSLWVPPQRASVLASVAGQLAAVPDEGLGYELLRQAGPVADALAALPAPQIRFGYEPGTPGAFVPERITAVRDPLAPREYVLEIDVMGPRLTWTYALHDEATIRSLAEQVVAELGGVAIPSPVPTMERHHVPGVSLAVIRDGRIAGISAYGRLDARRGDPVTPDTVFRVASVSKQVTSLVTLTLAVRGRLDLDADVNDLLTSWRVPGAEGAPITVRHLLANTSGLARDPEYPPYRDGEPVPTVLDALLGRAPARTPAVRRTRPVGTFEKNVVNYLVLEQLLTDVTGADFPSLARETVLDPLGMTGSGFEAGFPHGSGRPIAHGHDAFGTPIDGFGLIHPATAAGGLWTTAADLARVQLEIRRAYLGEPALITRELAGQMLTATPGSLYGLSMVVDRSEKELDFGAVGEFTGYWAMTMCRVTGGDGFVLLANGDGGRGVATFITELSGTQRFGAE